MYFQNVSTITDSVRNITHNHEINGLKEKVLHEAKHIVSDNLETVLTVSESNDLNNRVTVIIPLVDC